MQSRGHRSCGRRIGFTVLELLVAISVVGIVVSIALPAILHSRESARFAQCKNHLRQFGVAHGNFESTAGRFAPVFSRDIRPGASLPEVFERRPWPLSAHYWLLPYLDEVAIFGQIDIDAAPGSYPNDPPRSGENEAITEARIATFLCPSDDAPAGFTNYWMNWGTSPGNNVTPSAPVEDSSLDGFARRGRGVSSAEVVDGLSRTTLMSERRSGDRDPAVYRPDRDLAQLSTSHAYRPNEALELCRYGIAATSPHWSYLGKNWLFNLLGTTAYNHIAPPNSSIPDCAAGVHGVFTARAAHSEAVNVLFADGSVQSVSSDITPSVWRALGTIDGKESTGQP